MKKKQVIITIAALTVILIVILIVKLSGKKDSGEIFTKVKRTNLEIKVTVSGELQAENSEVIMAPAQLRNPMLGYMSVKIQDMVPEGTVVDSGRYVATLDRTEASNKLKDIDDDVNKMESQLLKNQLDSTAGLREARDNLLNMKYSAEEKQLVLEQSKYEAPAIIKQAQVELDKTGRAYEQAKQNYNIKVQQYNAAIAEVSVNLSRQRRKRDEMLELLNKFVIYAPKRGMVIYFKEWNGQKRKVGATINPWDLTVATLPDLTHMISKTYVNEIDISKVKTGQEVKVSLDAFPDKIFNGTVISVANVGEQLPNSDAKVFEVVIKIKESDPVMRPGMTSSNIIKVDEYNNVLSLPLEAIHNNDSLTFVYTRSGYKQLVLLGSSDENDIIIEKGLKEGEKIWLSIPDDAPDMKYKGLEIAAEIKKKKEKH